MLGELMSETTSLLDRRFVLNAFLPCLLLTGLMTTVIVATRIGAGEALTAWSHESLAAKGLAAVAFVAFVLLLAGTLSSQFPLVTRCYEGYWPSWVGRPVQLGRRWHRFRYRRLVKLSAENPHAYETLYLRYPPPGHEAQVMPTRLGNILKSAELYPRIRYGLDTVLVWPRLYPLLPDRFASSLGIAKANLDFMLAISTVAAVFSVFAGGYLAVFRAPWLFLICFWGGALVAWITYCGAASAALVYTQQLKTAFDLYRGDLLSQLGIAPPTSPDDERKCWRQLAAHWYRGVPASIGETPLPTGHDSPDAGKPILPLSGWFALAVSLIGLAVLAGLAVI
jgi:hypothetical protein